LKNKRKEREREGREKETKEERINQRINIKE
jgi:hypothetical protein